VHDIHQLNPTFWYGIYTIGIELIYCDVVNVVHSYYSRIILTKLLTQNYAGIIGTSLGTGHYQNYMFM